MRLLTHDDYVMLLYEMSQADAGIIGHKILRTGMKCNKNQQSSSLKKEDGFSVAFAWTLHVFLAGAAVPAVVLLD